MPKLSPLLIDTWNFFRRHFVAICALMFPFIIPLNLLNMIAETTAPDEGLVFFIIFITDLFLMPIYQGAIILYIASAISGTYLTKNDYYRKALKFWFPLLILYLFTFAALAIGFILFIFPALIILARLAFSEFYCIFAQHNATDAISKSWEQTKDYQWVILGGIVIIIAITVLPVWLIQAQLNAYGIDSPTVNFFLNLANSILSAPITIFGFRMFTLHQETPKKPEMPHE